MKLFNLIKKKFYKMKRFFYSDDIDDIYDQYKNLSYPKENNQIEKLKFNDIIKENENNSLKLNQEDKEIKKEIEIENNSFYERR